MNSKLEKTLKNEKGFTLIEASIITAVIGIMVGLIYSSMSGYKALKKYLNTPSFKVERADVIGSNKVEKFIEYKGERFYNEIDGKKLEQIYK